MQRRKTRSTHGTSKVTAAAALALAMWATATAAQIPAPQTLIANLTRPVLATPGDPPVLRNGDYSVGFKTGTAFGGYRITSITVDLKHGAADPRDWISARIEETDAQGRPNGTLVRMRFSHVTNPRAGRATFKWQAGYTTLKRVTKYAIVFYGNVQADSPIELKVTPGAGTDSASQSGWTIEREGAAHRPNGSTSWTRHDVPLFKLEGAQPGLQINDVTAHEGQVLQFAIRLQPRPPAGKVVSVDYSIQDSGNSAVGGLDARAGKDYYPAWPVEHQYQGVLQFNSNESEKSLWVFAIDDTHEDSGERFLITLSNAWQHSPGNQPNTGDEVLPKVVDRKA